MKQTKSPSKKRQEALNLFFDYCCETYKNNLKGNNKLLQQVYNIIIAKMHGEGYMDLFYGNTRNNGIYIKALQDFCQNKPIKGEVFRNWKIRQTSNEIIKLINEKL
jgi:hypothetical protein